MREVDKKMAKERKADIKIKRTAIRLQRRFGTKEIIITKAPKGQLSKEEGDAILAEIRKATKGHRLPAVAYQFNPQIPFPWSKDIITLKPKTGTAGQLVPKLRAVVKSKFGGAYKIIVGTTIHI